MRCFQTLALRIRVLTSLLVCLSSLSLCYAENKPGQYQDSQSTKLDSVPSPPPLIAPTGVLSQEDLMLPPQKAAEKEVLYKAQADEEYNRGDYGSALVSLQRAYLISKKPRYVANQGLVLEKMKRYPDAIKAMEYYLKTKPEPEMARSAQLVINRLRPEVKIETDPPGATVLINGQEFGQTPVTFRLIAGEHPLEMYLRGHETRKVTLFVIPGDPVFAQYKLEPNAEAFSLDQKVKEAVKQENHPPMNALQSSGLILGGLTLGLSLTSLWFTRAAIIDRNQARNQTNWEIAQSEASLFNSMSYATASIGVSAVVGALSWWWFSEAPAPLPLLQRRAFDRKRVQGNASY